MMSSLVWRVAGSSAAGWAKAGAALVNSSAQDAKSVDIGFPRFVAGADI
jgi:hypothetical protein